MLNEMWFGMQRLDWMLAMGKHIPFFIEHHGTTGMATLVNTEEETSIAVHGPSSCSCCLAGYQRSLSGLSSWNE